MPSRHVSKTQRSVFVQDQIANFLVQNNSIKMPASTPQISNPASLSSPIKHLMSAQKHIHQPAAGCKFPTALQGPAVIATPDNWPSNQGTSNQETPQPANSAIRHQMQQPPGIPEPLPKIGLPDFGSQGTPGLGLNEDSAAQNLEFPKPASQAFFLDPHQMTSAVGLERGCDAGLDAGMIAACQAKPEEQREKLTPSAKQLPIFATPAAKQALNPPQDPGCHEKTETVMQTHIKDRSPAGMQAGAGLWSHPQGYASSTPLIQDLQGRGDVKRQSRDQRLPPKTALLLATLSPPSASQERAIGPTQRGTGKFRPFCDSWNRITALIFVKLHAYSLGSPSRMTKPFDNAEIVVESEEFNELAGVCDMSRSNLVYQV